MEDLIQMDVVGNSSDRQKITGYKPPAIKEIKITPERRKQLMELYENVVVHNFGDDYHLSEEERIAKNSLYAAFKKIRVAKRKYSDIVGYVNQMRNCLECLDKVAEANKLIYPKKDFIRDVLSGKIEVYGLIFPKYKGKDRKEINWDYVSKLILDPSRDPKEELAPEEPEEIVVFSEAEADSKLKEVFSDEQIKEIFGDYPDEIREKMSYPFDRDEDKIYDGLVLEADYKSAKKLVKQAPEMIRAIKDIKQKRRGNQLLQDYVHQMQEDDFEAIERLDRERGLVFENDPPEFKGDILNKDDYNRYLYRLQTWEEENVREEYEGSLKTLEEINEEEIKKGLEAHGWNIRNIYGNKEKEKKLKKAQKEIDRKTKRLKARLLALDKQSSAKDKAEFGVNSKKKKNKKKKIKGKHRKNAKKTLDDIIMNASESGKKHNSFKSYKNEMEDFRWDR